MNAQTELAKYQALLASAEEQLAIHQKEYLDATEAWKIKSEMDIVRQYESAIRGYKKTIKAIEARLEKEQE
jgi:hypothetical protein